ncbi:MAG: NAD(P)H-dependent oxidoreductase [Halieaceae bacterium]|jgi:hypothetical protein|nr:NAD(P)H-dependent oxidoreductase [Halieaceae bacterium]
MAKPLLIVYHSQSGASFRLAAAARSGALAEPDATVLWRRAWDAGMDELSACGGILLVGAENSASVSGGLKDFLDRCFYPAQPLQLNLPYGLIVSAGNDGRGAQAQVERILRGFPLKPVAESIICRGEPQEEHLARAQELGQALSAGISMGIF